MQIIAMMVLRLLSHMKNSITSENYLPVLFHYVLLTLKTLCYLLKVFVKLKNGISFDIVILPT